jgi:soluble lytic murein transglycosylase
MGAWHAALSLRVRDPGDPGAVVDRARAELIVGSAQRARELLATAAATWPAEPAIIRLRAITEEALGEHATAARLYAAAAMRSAGPRRGVLEAKAAEAFDRAGLVRLARQHYRRAARLLPDVAGWLAVREAALWHDTALVSRLLGRAGPAEQRFAAAVRAAALIRAGDSVGGVHWLVAAGRHGRAAEVALALGDTPRARRLLYRGLLDSPVPVSGVNLLLAAFPPSNPDEISAVAGALRRLGRSPEAIRVLRIAADRSGEVGILVAAADALGEAGDRTGVAHALQRALRIQGTDGADQEHAHARLILRARGEAAGWRALVQFARRNPHHPAVPSVLATVAGIHERAGRSRAADSLDRVITARWPSHGAATRARLRLAVAAERSRQFGRARALYALVRDGGGAEAAASRFMLGRAAMAEGDTVAARTEWADLAQDDPVGYYGMLAREAARLPPLSVPPPSWPSAGDALRDVMVGLVGLAALDFATEAGEYVAWASRALEADPLQLLGLGRFLLSMGWTEPAVSVGWRAATPLGLTDPRVLRLVFPWPLREVVVAEANKFDLDPYLLAGLIRQESMFRPGVVSRAGARGLMQLMPTTAAEVARRLGVEWHDGLLGVADANLHVGAAHFASLVRRFGGDEVLALAAYNAGGSPVDRWRRRWGRLTDRVQFVDRIPYPETRGYVRTVVRNRALYRALYPLSSEQ